MFGKIKHSNEYKLFENKWILKNHRIIVKGTVMQIERALINNHLSASKVS